MNSRHPGRPKKRGPWPICKAVGCTRTTEGGARGFCRSHYTSARNGLLNWETGQQLREPLRVASYGTGARCTVEGCQRRPAVRGLCNPHWLRQQRGIPMDAPLRVRRVGTFTPCLLHYCGERAVSRGMCSAHAEQRRRGFLDANGTKLRERLPPGRPRKKDKWIGQDGYVLVRAPAGHPHTRVDGSILEHRLVMGQHLGRYLEEWEIVHHKDGDRSNNLIHNLMLLDGRAETASESHPPGHEFNPATAAQILLQQDGLPESFRQFLEQRLKKGMN